jgi:hypothetical protein
MHQRQELPVLAELEEIGAAVFRAEERFVVSERVHFPAHVVHAPDDGVGVAIEPQVEEIERIGRFAEHVIEELQTGLLSREWRLVRRAEHAVISARQHHGGRIGVLHGPVEYAELRNKLLLRSRPETGLRVSTAVRPAKRRSEKCVGLERRYLRETALPKSKRRVNESRPPRNAAPKATPIGFRAKRASRRRPGQNPPTAALR